MTLPPSSSTRLRASGAKPTCLKAGLKACPGRITERYCSPTKRLIEIPERIVAVINLPGFLKCFTSGAMAF